MDVFGDSDENEPNRVAPAAPPSSTPSSLPPPNSTIKKEVTVKEEIKVEKKKETKFVDEVAIDKDEPKERRVFDFYKNTVKSTLSRFDCSLKSKNSA